ncbi:MAG: Ig-like domain-containing protein, partial [Candidatus Promineifilaceae bacterium]
MAGLSAIALMVTPLIAGWAPAGRSVSALAPVVIYFSGRPLDPASVTGRFSLQPAVEGDLRVEPFKILFYPRWPLDYDQMYTVSLNWGVRGQNGLPLLLPARHSFTVGGPRLVYLSQPESEPQTELWQVGEDGGREVIARGPLEILDFSVAPDGRDTWLMSVGAADGSRDLVLGPHERLLDCQAALCYDGQLQPGGRLAAYTRAPQS